MNKSNSSMLQSGTLAAVGWMLTCIILVISLVQIRLASKVGSTR